MKAENRPRVDPKVYWVAVPAVYNGKSMVARQVARFGDFALPDRIEKLVNLGYIEPVTDMDLIEHCPLCKTPFMPAKSVKISETARQAVKEMQWHAFNGRKEIELEELAAKTMINMGPESEPTGIRGIVKRVGELLVRISVTTRVK